MDPERKHYLRLTLALYLVWLAAFQVVGRYAVTLPTRDLTMAIDRAIPVVPGFVWPYEACYVFPLVPLFVMRDWHRFNRAVLAMILANAVALGVYLFLPIAYPLPALGGSLAERVLALEYAADFQPGANKLPSTHVAFSWLMYLACRRQGLAAAADAALFMVAALISVSTVFVKQHLAIDVVTGIALAAAAWWAAGRLYERASGGEAEPRAAMRRLLRTAGVPSLVVAGSLLVLRAALARLFG